MANTINALEIRGLEKNYGDFRIDNLNLTVIGAVIIGGTSTAGGVGNIPMSFLGLLTMGVLTNTLSVMGISGYWQQVVQGLIMVIVIGSSSFANYRKTSSV